MSRRILVTCGLPYANGSIHLGHLVGYILADVWVRFLKMRGHDAIYICADDTHGTPVQVRARREGITPEALVARSWEEHIRDFADFQVNFDKFHTTHSPENQKWSNRIYESARAKGLVARRSVEQQYCEHDQMFLPDRFVRGTCPSCGAADQYGDVCEVCSTTYHPTDLKDPRCSICGQPPVRRASEHLYFELGKLAERLKEWTNAPGRLQSEVVNYVNNWLQEGLRDWDISRDGPYFGFPIPGETNKYFYVWLDAPIGYIASTDAYCAERGLNVAEYWEKPGTEIYHIIGKDIVYFHVLFWPAMLMAADLNLPNRVIVHGLLRVDGEKMSKSRGTFINARAYLDHLEPQYLRYYYAAKNSGRIEDIDLVFDDFVNRVNAELVNKIANLASRSLSFLSKRLEGKLGRIPDDAKQLIADAEAEGETIAAAYENRNSALAVERVCRVAEAGNLYIQNAAPWDAMKTDPERARDICTVAANLTKLIAVYLKPILPRYAADVERLLGLPDLQWADARADLPAGHVVGEFTHLVARLERASIDALVEASKQPEAAAPKPAVAFDVEPLAPEIAYDQFAKVDLRVAEIVAAEPIKGAKKILRLTLDLGPLGRRNVFAGIAQQYDPATLVGRKIVCVANLEPRQMSWGVSEAMITAAVGESAKSKTAHIALVEAPEGRPGEKVQ